jgi:hypothetical protein
MVDMPVGDKNCNGCEVVTGKEFANALWIGWGVDDDGRATRFRCDHIGVRLEVPERGRVDE